MKNCTSEIKEKHDLTAINQKVRIKSATLKGKGKCLKENAIPAEVKARKAKKLEPKKENSGDV